VIRWCAVHPARIGERATLALLHLTAVGLLAARGWKRAPQVFDLARRRTHTEDAQFLVRPNSPDEIVLLVCWRLNMR
jgi:hypothetical protein